MPSDRRSPAAGPVSRRRIPYILPILAVAFALGGCGHEADRVVRPSGATPGLSAAAIAPAVRALYFSRFVTNAIVDVWASNGRLDASWTYDPATGVWARHDSTYQTVFIGNGRTSTEWRNETVVEVAVRFSSHGSPVGDLLAADRAHMDLRVRQRRYGLDPALGPDDPADVTVRLGTTFGLSNGSADTLVADGTLDGWSAQVEIGDPRRVEYEGAAQVRFDFPDSFEVCPAERMSADIRVLEDGTEVDRFSGSFSAGEGEDRYTGSLDSQNGPWRYAIDGDRGCPSGAPAASLVGTRPAVTVIRLRR